MILVSLLIESIVAFSNLSQDRRTTDRQPAKRTAKRTLSLVIGYWILHAYIVAACLYMHVSHLASDNWELYPKKQKVPRIQHLILYNSHNVPIEQTEKLYTKNNF